MLFIMFLLLFESFPDSGYTTNCTMTANTGQKCPEIEDKKSKRDMIKNYAIKSTKEFSLKLLQFPV